MNFLSNTPVIFPKFLNIALTYVKKQNTSCHPTPCPRCCRVMDSAGASDPIRYFSYGIEIGIGIRFGVMSCTPERFRSRYRSREQL